MNSVISIKGGKMIGKPVSSVFGGTFRYGLIRETKTENGWTFFRCDWIDDEAYEMDMNRKAKLRNIERNEIDWIRADKVTFIDVESEIDKLIKINK